MARYSIRKFAGISGERKAYLVDEMGIPHFYSTLYVTTQIRNRSYSVDTGVQHLKAIRSLLDWAQLRNVDIESLFSEREFLSDPQLDDIRDFSQIKRSQRENRNVVSFKKDLETVSKQTHYSTLTSIAEYLSYIASVIANRRNDDGVDAKIQRMVKGLKRRRPRAVSNDHRTVKDKAVKPNTLASIRDVTQVGHEQNPWLDSIQLRNYLIIELLIVLGIRRGELCAIQTVDINLRENLVEIRRRQDDPNDSRSNQPKAKTAERILILNEQLAQLIEKYINKDRSKYKVAKKHGYLFVSHTGKTKGQPISLDSINKMFNKLKELTGDKDLSPHSLRHQWNYEFSNIIDGSDDPISNEREDALRNYQMGWSPTSNMASTYNRRKIVEQSHKVTRKLQDKLYKGKKNGK